DSAKFAETIDPERMVVVTCAIPYKAQVEEFQRALRARSIDELTEFPEYRGFVVERLKCGLDGTPTAEGWQPLDLQATLGDLFAKTIDFEPDVPPATMDADLAALYPRVLPPDESHLLVPRPKLHRGEYPPVNLPSVTAALKSLKEKNQTAEVLTPTQQRLSDTDIFQRGSGQQQPGGGPGGGGPGGGPGGGASGAFGGGDGLRGGLRLPPGARFTPGGGDRPNQPGSLAVPEDAWVMRFIDITADAGFSYRYRVKLNVLNPNYKKPAKDLGIPSFADKELLQSDWFELPAVDPKQADKPAVVRVPPEEFLYAAAKDDRNHKVTEKMPPAGLWDDTWVQMQKWYAYIHIPELGSQGGEPFGEWLVWDIKAVRGQQVGETTPVTLPIWSMVQGTFTFRDNVRRARPAGITRGSTAKSEPSWMLELTPTPPVVLVDFEGGTGSYIGPKNKSSNDSAGVEMLFLTSEGKLRVARSGQDLNDPDRVKREDGWKAWLMKVNEDWLRNKLGVPAGGPGGPGGDGRPGGGSDR
ncbi:MAG TPA: hypothetical protein VGF55_11270, partial [Gemmataceae bacterium]